MSKNRRLTSFAAVTPRRARRAVALAAMFAMLLQAIAPAHFHTPMAAGTDYELSAGAPASSAAVQVAAHRDRDPIACAVCQLLAAAGAAVLSRAAALPADWPREDALTLTAPAAPRQSAHSWRSRAPPAFL